MSEIIPIANAAKVYLTMDPMSQIQKEPLFTTDKQQSSSYSVRIWNDKKEKFEEITTVKEGYLVMENHELKDLAEELADESDLQWKESRIYFNGKQFTYAIETEGITADVAVGDAINLGLMFQNSYDGTMKSRVQAYVNRLACSNGMVAPMFFDPLTFKHDHTSEDWQEQVRQSLQYLQYAGDNLQEFAALCAKMVETKITLDELSNIRRNYLDSRIPSALWGRVIDRYLSEERAENDSVWGFVNACTAVTWHENMKSQQYLGHNKFIMQQMMQWTAKETNTIISPNLRFQPS
jgi:hypothetical protein